jgi:hypothetical protein
MMEERLALIERDSRMMPQHSHRPYASMNWIRFNGSLRCFNRDRHPPAASQPLVGTPLVKGPS